MLQHLRADVQHRMAPFRNASAGEGVLVSNPVMAKPESATGVDLISVGALTHSVNVFDIGLDLTEG